MSRRHWMWGIWLLAVHKLLWAKLPGPSQARRGLLLRKKEGEEGVEVFDGQGQIAQFFSDQITGITVQQVNPRSGAKYTAGSGILRSRVRVKITRPDTAELGSLAPEVEDLLTSGSGQIAIVTGTVEEGKLEVESEFLAKGIGHGTWEIQTREE